MKLILVRHGESVANKEGLVCGQMDSPLTENGRQQVMGLSSLLSNVPVKWDVCYTTSLSRAMDTANILNEGLSSEIIVSEQLRETDTGIYSERRLEWYLEEIDARIKQHGLYPDVAFIGGESLVDMSARVIDWYRGLLESREEVKSVLVAAHGGPINVLLHHILGVDLSYFSAFDTKNASASIVELQGENDEIKPVLTHFNLTV